MDALQDPTTIGRMQVSSLSFVSVIFPSLLVLCTRSSRKNDIVDCKSMFFNFPGKSHYENDLEES